MVRRESRSPGLGSILLQCHWRFCSLPILYTWRAIFVRIFSLTLWQKLCFSCYTGGHGYLAPIYCRGRSAGGITSARVRGMTAPGAARLNTAAPCLARRGWAGTLGFVSPYSDHQLSPAPRCKSHRYQPGFSLDNDNTNGTAMIVLVTIWSWYFTFHTCAPVN